MIRSAEGATAISAPWGELVWLVNGSLTPGAQQTLGLVRIDSGHENPLHAHPNCEELLLVLSGTCVHRLGDDEFDMQPGVVIVVPPGIPHQARCTSPEPLHAVISFSAPDRETVQL